MGLQPQCGSLQAHRCLWAIALRCTTLCRLSTPNLSQQAHHGQQPLTSVTCIHQLALSNCNACASILQPSHARLLGWGQRSWPVHLCRLRDMTHSAAALSSASRSSSASEGRCPRKLRGPLRPGSGAASMPMKCTAGQASEAWPGPGAASCLAATRSLGSRQCGEEAKYRS